MTIQTEMQLISGGTAGLSGYLAQPDGSVPLPGLVVIHELFGLNEDIRGIADRFAADGYAALAVDLFAGRNRAVCMARFMSALFVNTLDHAAIHDLKAALTYLGTLPQVDANRLGAVGFCMGGSFAIAWACTDDRLKVIAPFYGMNPRPLEAVARSCPVVGSYPEKDFSAGMGLRLDAELDQYGIAHDIKIYPGATHSFFNGRRDASEANRAAAADAWERMNAFFAERLKI
jgi:carboxymethylenebutenolidase